MNYAKIKLHGPLLLTPYTHPNPRFRYSQVGHIYPWTKDNRTPVMPGRILTLEGFWLSSSHQVLLLPLYFEPNPKLVFQTVFRFLLLFLPKLYPVGSNTLFCPPGQIQPFLVIQSTEFSEAWTTGLLVGLCSLAVFQPPRGHFCFSCGLCLVLLWVNEDALPALSVLPAWRSPAAPCLAVHWATPQGKGTAPGPNCLKIILQWLCRFVPSALLLYLWKCQKVVQKCCWVWRVKLPSRKYALVGKCQ